MLNSTRRRIEAIRAHTDRRYFMNLASADPSLYTRRGLYVVHKDSPKTIAVFSLTGVVTSAKLRRITGYDRRITVLPFREQWIGIASVLGNIFKRNVLFFKSSVHGLVFSTAPFRRRKPHKLSDYHVIMCGLMLCFCCRVTETPASRQKTCRIGTARPAEDTGAQNLTRWCTITRRDKLCRL
ncbi:hypothetical protein DENSPDRAFT_90839 [Dentipellis sp. KUC8613]|nr:hypothetical protein DENSPDRAFT_90839 [Dentipellis sp. KUC8613]